MMDASAPSFRAAFDRTLRLSRYVARVTAARPALAAELEERSARAFVRPEMREALAGDAAGLGVRLRRLRERVMVTLAHRDLNGMASLDEVFATMSALAEECIAAAADRAQACAAEQMGPPAAGTALLVAAMGKLGGGELNVSSDVDLVFLYGAEGETAGVPPRTHSEYFSAAGREIIALLSEPTADGQAFRVDMRLRPFGDSGPLATSLAALEDYFVGHGRPWERYAWLKARVVCGPEAGTARARRALRVPALPRLRDARAAARAACAHLRSGDPPAQGRRHQGGQRGASARWNSRCSSSRWCAAGATRRCARRPRAPRCAPSPSAG